jgi:hypothetical protein
MRIANREFRIANLFSRRHLVGFAILLFLSCPGGFSQSTISTNSPKVTVTLVRWPYT